MARTADDEQLLSSVDSGIATITFNNPHRGNALSNHAFGRQLPDLIASLNESDDVRVIMFTGTGSAFCGGTELDADGFGHTEPSQTRALIERVNRTTTLLRYGDKPSIAVVNGVAIGAGVGLAAACDMRIAAPGARFRLPYVRLGLSPDVGLLATLPEIVGVPLAVDLVLTGRWVDADEALRIGLVNEVTDDPLATALDRAGRIVQSSPAAVAASRRILKDSAGRGFARVVLEDEPTVHAQLLHADDQDRYFTSYLSSVGLRRRPDGTITRA
jgi:enoyl-CoA hydratase/carnithine racemase